MTEDSWHRARLIPTSGIKGSEEQERRATSALLAVLAVVDQFAHGLLKPLGAPAGKVETFIEVPFQLDGHRLFPDGLIRVSRGSRAWTALVEVKTGVNELQSDQLEAYLDIARNESIDALVTISNQIPPAYDQHPTKVDKRKLRKVAIHHWSWSMLLSAAVVQKEHRGVTDPEQAWILGELIRYLEHPKSGALEFEDMGPNWVSVRDAVSSGTLRTGDTTISDVTTRFDALLRFASLRLGRQLGTEVTPVHSRKEQMDPAVREQNLRAGLVDDAHLFGALRIPHAVGPMTVEADLRANQLTCAVDIDAPRDGRALTRVNWLLRQLKQAPDDTRLECFLARAHGSSAAELLASVREDPKILVTDPSKEIRTFRIAHCTQMGTKRGRGRGAFIDTVLDAVDNFYADTVQHLKPWSPPAPKMRESEIIPAAPADAASALSSQDEGEESGPSREDTGSADS